MYKKICLHYFGLDILKFSKSYAIVYFLVNTFPHIFIFLVYLKVYLKAYLKVEKRGKNLKIFGINNQRIIFLKMIISKNGQNIGIKLYTYLSEILIYIEFLHL